jgi:hypothetical protein
VNKKFVNRLMALSARLCHQLVAHCPRDSDIRAQWHLEVNIITGPADFHEHGGAQFDLKV